MKNLSPCSFQGVVQSNLFQVTSYVILKIFTSSCLIYSVFLIHCSKQFYGETTGYFFIKWNDRKTTIRPHLPNFGANVFTALLSKTLSPFYTNVLSCTTVLLIKLNQPLRRFIKLCGAPQKSQSFQNELKKKKSN